MKDTEFWSRIASLHHNLGKPAGHIFQTLPLTYEGDADSYPLEVVDLELNFKGLHSEIVCESPVATGEEVTHIHCYLFNKDMDGFKVPARLSITSCNLVTDSPDIRTWIKRLGWAGYLKAVVLVFHCGNDPEVKGWHGVDDNQEFTLIAIPQILK